MCTNSLSPLVLASLFALGTTLGFAQVPPPAGGVVRPAGPVSKNDPGYPTLQVESDWEVSQAAADQGVYRKALGAIDEYLRNKGHNPSGMTSLDYVKNISRNRQPTTKEFPGGVGTMYQTKIEVVLTPDVMRAVVAHERSLLAVTRMFWLGKLTLGALGLLAIAAIYFRLEDWTKGYYSTWLRILATTGGAAVVTGVVFSLS
jgi:hypothetical protein